MRALCLSLLVLTGFSLGCGSGYNLHPVTGKVTLDGAPLSGATVTLKPLAEGKPATGTADANGVYTITDMRPDAGPGAEPGEYRVGILWYKATGPDLSQMTGESSGYKPEEESKAARNTVQGPKTDLPVAYQNPDTSGLTISVRAGENKHDFELKSTFKGAGK